MPNLEQAQTAVEQHFVDEWNDAAPVVFENAPIPAALKAESFTGDFWIKFSFEAGDSYNSCNSEVLEFRTMGRISVDVHMKKDNGPIQFARIVSDLNDIFRGRTVSGVRIFAPVISPQIGDDSWFRKVVSFPFNFDEK